MRPFAKPVAVTPEYNGPTNFAWLIPGLLGGCPRPGIFRGMDRDLIALQRVQTRLLVTLTDEWTPDADVIAEFDIDSLHFPMQDQEPPTLQQAIDICRQASIYADRGEAVVFHCRAGKGRTGTLLAAMLIWAGDSSAAAILATRQQNHKWIESESQLAFLEEFEIHCRQNQAELR